MSRFKIARKYPTIMLYSAGLLVIVLLWAMVQPASASRPGYVTAWSDAYPSSTAISANCQLCHQQSFGGDGWNAYGWGLREALLDDAGLTIGQAIVSLEAADVDGNGVSNLDEINGNAQPGWSEGSTNTIFLADGSTLTDQAPPDGVTVDSTVEPTHVSMNEQQIASSNLLPFIGLFSLISLTAGIKLTRD